MKITRQLYTDLRTLIIHARIDIGYGGGGTYNDGEDEQGYVFDKKEAAAAERAIKFIIKLLAQNV